MIDPFFSLSPIRRLLKQERFRQAADLRIAALSAAGAAVAASLLLGLSGWFLAGAAMAGAAGPAVAAAFNYLLPSAAIRLLAISRTGLRYTERVSGHAAALKALADIRPALFAGLAAAPAARSLGVSSGEATARLVQDIDALQDVFIRNAAPWSALAAVTAASALISLASLPAVLVFLAAFSGQLILGAWIGRRRSRAPAAETLAAAGELKDQLQAYAAASAELRCYGLAPAAIDHLMTLEARLGESKRRSWVAAAEMGAAQPALTGLTVAGVLLLSLHAPAALAALAALSASVALESAGGLLAAMDRAGAVDAASDRLDDLLASPASPAHETRLGRGWIELHVGRQVHRLGLGERWLLTGASGAGKTSILEGLIRLRDTPPGRIRINGFDTSGLDLASVRSLFTHAPQDARLIGGTVRDNLRLADPLADEAALWRVLKCAQLDRKIAALPLGLDAWIAEGGVQLSGGERRRLSLARALLRPAPWLLLDEPTENLDAETEARVVEGLRAHLDRTRQGLILISHRPAAQALADHRLCLDAPARLPASDAPFSPVLR